MQFEAMSNNLTAPRPDTEPDAPVPPAEKKRRLELSLTQIVGGALAAMTAAALGSTLGLAGTLVGAAFASIVAGVATALYTASLQHTREKVKTVFSGRGAHVAAEPPPPVRGSRTPGKVPWKRAVVLTLAVFALATVALTGYEFLTGHALSGGKGTTVEQVGTAKPKAAKTEKPAASPSPSATPTESTPPSAEPTPTLPVDPVPTATEPSATPTPSPTPSATPSSDTSQVG
jgi:hypothetical protein